MKSLFFPQQLCIYCFGKFRLIYGGRHVPISNRKAEELLAYLTVTGTPVSKEKAAGLLWEASEPNRARDSLNKVCAYLRKLKKNTVTQLPLYIRRDELYLDMTLGYYDIREFKRLCENETDAAGWERAVALYTAPLLLENCYDWAVLEEAYYDIRYGELLKKLADYYRTEERTDMALFYEEKLRDFR